MAYNPGPQGDDKPGCICILIPIPRLLAQLVERPVTTGIPWFKSRKGDRLKLTTSEANAQRPGEYRSGKQPLNPGEPEARPTKCASRPAENFNCAGVK